MSETDIAISIARHGSDRFAKEQPAWIFGLVGRPPSMTALLASGARLCAGNEGDSWSAPRGGLDGHSGLYGHAGNRHGRINRSVGRSRRGKRCEGDPSGRSRGRKKNKKNKTTEKAGRPRSAYQGKVAFHREYRRNAQAWLGQR